jgi:hypothetical protein
MALVAPGGMSTGPKSAANRSGQPGLGREFTRLDHQCRLQPVRRGEFCERRDLPATDKLRLEQQLTAGGGGQAMLAETSGCTASSIACATCSASTASSQTAAPPEPPEARSGRSDRMFWQARSLVQRSQAEQDLLANLTPRPRTDRS